MKNIMYIIIGISFLTFYACHSGHDHEGEHAHDEEETSDEHVHGSGAQEDVDEVTLTREQMDLIQVDFAHIEKKELSNTLKANGLLKVPNQNKATITALMGGVVQEILVTPGQYVQKGKAIVSLKNTSYIQLQEKYLQMESQVSLAKLELNRQIELNTNHAGILKNLQLAEANLSGLETQKASLSIQLELIGISSASLTNSSIQSTIYVRSPISGAVSHIRPNIGSYVDINSPIADVVDNSQLHLDLFVYEKDLPKLEIGQTIHFALTNNPIKEYDAKIHSISNTFEENIKAISVHAAVFGNKDGLIDGMNITASVSLDEAKMNAVPTDAVMNQEGQYYVLIEQESFEDESKSFRRVPVVKGVSDVGHTAVILIEDLPEETRIVTKGSFFIFAKMTNQGEGHSH